MSPDAMTSGWYYAKAGAPVGQEIGPLSWQELYLLAHDGSLVPADLVWNPKLPRGVKAGQVPGLFPSQAIPGPAETTRATPAPAVQEAPAEKPAAPIPPAAPPVQTPIAHAEPAESTPQTTGEPGPTAADDQRPSAESLEAVSAVESAGNEPGASPKKRGHTNLPWLILLLAAAVAAAGLATYFTYLRGLWT